MATRWEVEQAIMESQIDPHGRHLLLTLLTKSNATTAAIPPRHVPRFEDMAAMTGISKSTVTEWFRTLSDAGWITRESIPGEARKALQLHCGDPMAARVMRIRKSKDDDVPYRHAVPDEGAAGTASVPPGGISRTATRYQSVPPGGTGADPHCLKDSPTESQTITDLDQSAASADDACGGTLDVDFGDPVTSDAKKPRKSTRKKKTSPEADEENKRLYRVTKVYTDRVMSHWHKSREVVKVAFGYHFTEEKIIAGLTKLADAKDPLTIDSLRIAIQGSPSWASSNSQPRSGSREGLGSTRHRVQDSHADIERFKENI